MLTVTVNNKLLVIASVYPIDGDVWFHRLMKSIKF